ncbi:MAG TPA: helix-turn-helix transcriptional regulator [Gemmatimonadales bacterium]|nr:helix-turn-helix transcriptional regulator [Gemmatimonadales bacterium]
MPEVVLSGAAGRIQARLNELARDGRPMSQTELALAVGVGRSTVNQWLSGVSQPDRRRWPELYEKIAVALGLDAKEGAVWILAGETIRREPHASPKRRN